MNASLFLPLLKNEERTECKYISAFLDVFGNTKWIRIHASNILDENQKTVGATGTLSDITDLVQLDLERQKDLDLARKVQLSVVSNPIKEDNIQIDSEYLASMALSGDVYCWEKINNNSYAVILFDVMGHGVASSLITMTIRSLLGRLMEKDQDPKIVYEKLNSYMLQLFDGANGVTTYLTAIYMVIDTEKKTVHYVNAGHPVGLMIADTNKKYELKKGCLPVGIMTDHPIETEVIHYENSATLLLYTDGLTDILKTESSKDFLLNCMKTYKKSNRNLAAYVKKASELPDKLPDDLCVISIELK